MPNNSKIALAMILKGNEPTEAVDRCLSTIAKWVDGIFLTITTPDEGVADIAKKYGAHYEILPYKFHKKIDKKTHKWLKDSFKYEPKVKVGDRIFLFDKARNYNWSKVGSEYEWILWIDADDVFRVGEELRNIVATAEENKAESVFLKYIYQAVIEDGKIKDIVIEHLRERIVKNNGAYKWVAPIHETLIEQRPTKKIHDKRCDILHLTTDSKMRKAIERNMKTLEYSIYDTKAKDPRPIYYLGKAYYDLRGKGDFEKALGLFKIYLYGADEYDNNNKSGWGEERSQCWEYVAEIYRAQGKVDYAISACMNALKESYRFPSIYLNLGLCYLVKKDWEAALHWVKQALNVPPPDTSLVNNPRDLRARALEITYHASLNLSLLDEARAAADKLLETFPGDEEMTKRSQLTHTLTQEREATRSIVLLSKYLEAIGEGNKLRMLIGSAPSPIANNPFLVDLQKRVFPPKEWGNNEIAILCGQGFTTWSPKLLEMPDQSFIGGSEEAVIYLSKELADLGWKVTVYADPGEDEGEHEGVTYLPYYKFNPLDSFNVLVAWRNPQFVDGDIKAKQVYLWAHDILNALDFTEERVAKWTKIFVLSPWHRENIPSVPDDKIVISGNGITL